VPKKRKAGKGAALKAYKACVKRICQSGLLSPPEARNHLLERMTAFAASPKAKGDFCPMPATWLNQDRFDDDPTAWEEVSTSGKPKPTSQLGGRI